MSDITTTPEHGVEQHGVGHVVSVRVLLTVWAALVVLTVLTVAATYVNLGHLNIWVALLIAALKASLVLLYFMHLRYDSPINGFIFVTAITFVALFIGGTITDTQAYQKELQPPPQYNTEG